MNDHQTLVRVHLLISGLVQGVGFRMFTLNHAEILDITGWVRNTGDDRVEVMAQGSQENINKLLALLENGPKGAYVTDIEKEWLAPIPGEFYSFRIRGNY
ncbi:MAG TPA: acylphosphatase [Anaerolineaceae bacterium]